MDSYLIQGMSVETKTTETKMLTRRALIGSLAVTPFLTSAALAAKPEVFAVDGIAIRGTDPVAYFKKSMPVAGSSEFETTWMGATWRFESAENLADFEANPEAFAPKYGGYCAYAVSKGGTATTDPEAWTIWEDRLYLNFNRTVRGIWSDDIPGNVAKADANWPGVLA